MIFVPSSPQRDRADTSQVTSGKFDHRNPFFARGLGLTVITGLVLVFIVGLVFAVAYGSQRITQSATDLHKADEALRAATVVRAQVALSVFLARMDDEFGTVSTAAQDLSRSEAHVGLADLEVSVEELRAGGESADTELDERSSRFVGIARTTLSLLENGDAMGAQQIANAELDVSFRALVDEAVTVRNDLRSRVEISDSLLGRASTVARFLVAFLVPVAVILTYRAISRRQHREMELRRRLDAERELAVSRDEFIANASHELRTPLTSITGMAMLLEEDSVVMESELAAELVDIIISESSDLGRMVDDLLTTARIDAGALQFAFEDIEVAIEVAEAAEAVSRAGSDISIECAPGRARVDRLRLRQVVRNLLSNAIKYGGPDIRVDGSFDDRTYLLTVSDDGSGLPPEIASDVFERFIHQGHETATIDSVGLGLSIVRSLTDAMGGSVRYDRSDGRTRFLVRFPLVVRDLPVRHEGDGSEHSAIVTRTDTREPTFAPTVGAAGE